MVVDVNCAPIGASSAVLSKFARDLIDDSVAKGFLASP
jgi:hypothetical protein